MFKWHSVWFLASGMDKKPGLRVENDAMKQADRIRRQMEKWLDEQTAR